MKPIPENSINNIYKELYDRDENNKIICKYAVHLDEDPSIHPKSLSEKIAQTQTYKNRVIVLLNIAISNKQYWDTMLKNLDTLYNTVYSEEMSKITDKVSVDIKKSMAETNAYITLAARLNIDNYVGHYNEVVRKHSEAVSLYTEIKNIYDNLNETSVNLAIQLKSMMLNAKVYGNLEIEQTEDKI